MLDIFISKNIGITGILLGIVGYSGGYLDKNFSKDSKITIILMVMGATLLFELAAYILNCIILSYGVQVFAFIKIVLVEILYNSILTIILYPLLKKGRSIYRKLF